MKHKALATLSLLAVFVSLWLFLGLAKGTVLTRWQEGLHYNYFSHILFFAIPLAALLVLRRKPQEYGLETFTLGREIKVGMIAAAVLIALPLLAEILFGKMEIEHRGAAYLLSTIVFQIVFAGFGEELLFRGFFQGEFNRVFRRRFCLGGVRFGWSLFLVAGLFSVGHLIQPVHPFHDRYSVDIGWGVRAAVLGIVFGLVREHFGGIVAASMMHAGINLSTKFYQPSLPAEVASFLAVGVVCYYLGHVMFSNGLGKAEVESETDPDRAQKTRSLQQ